MNKSPKISLIIPVYNGAKYLPNLFKSLDSQSFTDWEAIIVDDSSTDESYEILLRKQAEDTRYRIFRKPNERYANRGVVFAFERLQGEWFYYMSQDDTISPDCLEKMMLLTEKPDVDAIVPEMATWSDNGYFPCPNVIKPGQIISGNEAFLLSINWKIHGFVLFRSDLRNNFTPDVENINSDEYDTRRFYYFSRKVAFSGGVFNYHVGNPEAITVRWNIDRIGFLRTSEKLWDFSMRHGVLSQAAPEICALTADLGIGLLDRYSKALRNGQTMPEDGNKIAETLRSVRFMFKHVGPTQYVAAKFLFNTPLGINSTLFLYRIWRALKNLRSSFN